MPNLFESNYCGSDYRCWYEKGELIIHVVEKSKSENRERAARERLHESTAKPECCKSLDIIMTLVTKLKRMT